MKTSPWLVVTAATAACDAPPHLRGRLLDARGDSAVGATVSIEWSTGDGSDYRSRKAEQVHRPRSVLVLAAIRAHRAVARVVHGLGEDERRLVDGLVPAGYSRRAAPGGMGINMQETSARGFMCDCKPSRGPVALSRGVRAEIRLSS